MNFLGELKRRSVFRMGVFYLLGAWVVLQIADVLVGVVGLPDWTMRLVGLILLLGLPLVLVLSWVYELTPEGLKKDASVDEAGRQVTVTPVQRIILFASFAAVMVGGYLLIEQFLVEQQKATESEMIAEPSGPRTEPVTLAMLPMQPGPAPTYLENGREQSLADRLFRVTQGFEDIRALPSERVMPSDDSNKTFRELAEEQFVTHFLISRTREQDEAIWLNAELVDADTDERLWAYSTENPIITGGELDSTTLGRLRFEMGKALEANGLSEMAADTDNPLAFEAWLRGHELDLRDIPQDQHFDRRLVWFEEAAMLDPEFVDAHNAIAKHWFMKTHHGVPWADVREPSIAAASRALKIDPENPNANANMSRILALDRTLTDSQEEWEQLLEESIDYGRKAVQLAPRNPSIREDYVRALWGKDWNEVVNQIQIILRYEPDEAMYLEKWMISPLVWAGRLEEAEAQLELMKEKHPDRNWTVGPEAFSINRAKGQLPEALEALHSFMKTEPDVWIQDYMSVLSDIGALEAVVRWGRYLSDWEGGSRLNFVWAYVVAANKHLGQMESALGLVDELPDSVLDPQQKQLQHSEVAYVRALKAPLDDPDTKALLDQLDALCAHFEQGPIAQAGYELAPDMLQIASKCYVLSARTGSDRSRLGEAVLRFFEQREPFVPTNPGALHGRVDSGKMLLIYALGRMGKVEQAVAEFREIYDQGFSRPHHFRTFAVVPDIEGIYNGLGSHPEFLEMFNELESRNAAIRADITENSPWIFDPALSSPHLDSLDFVPGQSEGRDSE